MSDLLVSEECARDLLRDAHAKSPGLMDALTAFVNGLERNRLDVFSAPRGKRGIIVVRLGQWRAEFHREPDEMDCLRSRVAELEQKIADKTPGTGTAP